MDANNRNRLEDRRQLEHLLPIGFAFLLPYISYSTALFLAGLAVIYGLYVSPRLLKITTRDDEKEAGYSPGKLIYGASVFILLLIFHDRIYLVAGVWAILAAGDSLSNIVGRRWGAGKLPYNPAKSFVGVLTFWVSGTLAAWCLISWNLPPDSEYQTGQILLYAAVASLLSALAESLPSTLDDNLIIAWIASLSLVLLFSIESSRPELSGSWQAAFLINLLAACTALLLRWISPRGTVLAAFFGFFTYVSLGWQAYIVLCSFLALGSVATKLGKQRKEELLVAEDRGGQRGLSNVLCNGLVPFLIACFGLWLKNPVLGVAYAAAVATAAFDTVGTEIGQWLGRRPVNPLTFRRVTVGTPGGGLLGRHNRRSGSSGPGSIDLLLNWLAAVGIRTGYHLRCVHRRVVRIASGIGPQG